MGGVILNAQSPCDSTPANCSWDLYGGIIFSDIDSANCTSGCTGKWPAITYGASSGLKDVFYVDDNSCNSSDGCNTTDLTSLYYIVYFPKHNYIYNPSSGTCSSKLPCIILFHGGSYSDCNGVQAGGNNIKLMGREYARRGFVAVVAEYRRGSLEDPTKILSNTQKCTSAQRNLAYDRAITDGRGVIRNVIYRENNWSSLTDPPPYRIDIHQMFLGGTSSGAGIVDNLAYYQYQGSPHDQLDQVLTGSPLISDASILDKVNQTGYYDCGACTYDYFGNANILGVMSCWGGTCINIL